MSWIEDAMLSLTSEDWLETENKLSPISDNYEVMWQKVIPKDIRALFVIRAKLQRSVEYCYPHFAENWLLEQVGVLDTLIKVSLKHIQCQLQEDMVILEGWQIGKRKIPTQLKLDICVITW
ncbi:MAG: hypothetical protein HY507_01790 [Candidatus Zambryskibacteria bacterium]|nr:hypothetical protein [Candidatus Zambryskibacteria bacterium]